MVLAHVGGYPIEEVLPGLLAGLSVGLLFAKEKVAKVLCRRRARRRV